MTTDNDNRPRPEELLFKNLFEYRTSADAFQIISEGISVNYRNADRLLSDAQYLVDGGRLSSARFMLATAREEIAKSYILLDACKLDWEKHVSVLRRLCRAFYRHIPKHAYLETLVSQNIDMEQVKNIWETEVKHWWPADYGDGLPDMPHDTFFNRELPLYVDYGDYERCWLEPNDSDQEIYFMELPWIGGPMSRTSQLIRKWKQTDAIKICSPEVLAILNSTFKTRYLPEDATWAQLYHLYMDVAQRVSRETDISVESFMASPLVRWPLYRFV